MAEFLIYNKDHWSKTAKLTTEQAKKLEGCYKKDDVIEVREDGYWDKRGFNKKAFRVVKKPGMSVKEALYLEKELFDSADVAKRLSRRKYQITDTTTSSSSVVEVEKLSITEKTESSVSDG